jgi:DeoR family glycerol-3-phosphate regulon repressor
LVEHCHYRILVIDSTKFDTESRCLWGKMSDYDCVITDQQPAPALLSTLTYQGVEVLY